MLLFVLSAAVPPPTRYALWIVALFIDVATPILTLEHQRKQPSYSSTKLPERFGLLVILVLGEIVIGTVNGLAGQDHLTWTIGFTAVIGMLLAFSLWWIYFDFVARRAAKPSVWWTMIWAYGHLPLVMGLVSVGAAVLVLVGNYKEVDAAKQLLPLAIGVTLAVTGLLEMTLRRGEYEPTHQWLSPMMKVGVGAIAASLMLWSASMTISALLLTLLLLLLSQIGYGVYVWLTQDLPMDDSLD